MKIKEFFAFVSERHKIYRYREVLHQPKPWTDDPILRRYRFCNVYRELDRVTEWIRENWRDPHRRDPDLWFALTVARFLNLPASLKAIGYPVPFEKTAFKRVLRRRKESGEVIFNGAYMIHADAVETGLKTDYLADFVFTPMWKDRESLRPRKTDSLRDFYTRLREYRDIGSFMAGQIIADTKFTPPLRDAEDWWTFAVPGPGSLRGMNLICGRDMNAKWKEDEWYDRLGVLQEAVDPLVKDADMPRLSSQDLQNCLCEYSKYMKAKLGLGRPKTLFNGA